MEAPAGGGEGSRVTDGRPWDRPMESVRDAASAEPPKPPLQAHPQTDLAKFRAQKEALLSGYAWTNAQHDYARIPIQRAMQIYAAQHAHPASPSTSGSAPASASSGATPAAQGAGT